MDFRDVTKIGHYTNHLPTEIIITEEKQLNIKFGEINEGDKVLAIGEIEDEVLTIRSLFIVSKAPEE